MAQDVRQVCKCSFIAAVGPNDVVRRRGGIGLTYGNDGLLGLVGMETDAWLISWGALTCQEASTTRPSLSG